MKMRDCNCNNTDFVGTIVDHMALPNGALSQKEADNRYAMKEDTAEHFETIRRILDTLITAVNAKAEQSSLDNLTELITQKIGREELQTVYTLINSKANSSDLAQLILLLDNKVNRSELTEIKTEISDIQEDIEELKTKPSGGCHVYIQDNEPDDNDCIWIQPFEPSPSEVTAMLELAEDTGNDGYKVDIDNTTYAIENAVNSEEELTPGKYFFAIQ